jgi:glycosyltransferase involved in cell wall biosynthesis
MEFPRPIPNETRRTFCFISQEYPPRRIGGVGRYIHQVAKTIAHLGHHVHVVTCGEGHDRVDLEDRVWVHRVLLRPSAPPVLTGGVRVPEHIWNHAATMLSETKLVAQRHRVDCVYAPIWDCEGLAVMLDGKFPIVTGLQTTLHFWLNSQPYLRADPQFMSTFGYPMLSIERLIVQESTAIHAISSAIASDIEHSYDVALSPPRLSIIPLGLEDASKAPRTPPPALPPGMLRILFAGRLEARKGIDILLSAVQQLFPKYPNIHLDIVGNDRIPGEGGTPYRRAFEASARAAGILDRVKFHGEVSDEILRGFYHECDVLVVPSRYESFGLVLVEGMMFGKPVIACRAGGMTEVVVEGVTGLLAEPGDVLSLERCLIELIDNVALRKRLARSSRHRYLEHFTPLSMARRLAEVLCRAAEAHLQS